MNRYQPPFPYFGGKLRIANRVWQILGDVKNYIEPFAGSAAVLMSRPHNVTVSHIETINDLDGFVANFWRAVAYHAEEVAQWCNWPVNELDLYARHKWLMQNSDDLSRKLRSDPEYCDAKIAGWWCWGSAASIGKLDTTRISRTLPHLGCAGQGIHRPRTSQDLSSYFAALQQRLRRVRVCSGDWSRVLTRAVLNPGKIWSNPTNFTGVFLDPPYDQTLRHKSLYTREMESATAVRDWAVEWGDHPNIRIIMCGLEGEHDFPHSWSTVVWRKSKGYASKARVDQRPDEVLWCSPNCRVDEA